MVILPPDLYSTQEGPPPGWLGDMSHTPLETVWDSYCPGWLPTGTPQSCLPHGQESFSPGPLYP